jgi:hypothetical protein
MKVLIYKRTHKGDPDKRGIFGNQDCMGRIRSWNYDAVIGIGGNSPWKEDTEIRRKINWIGLEPKKIPSKRKRGNYVVFSHFELYEEKGGNIMDKFPNLFEYMYGSRKRFDMSSNLSKDVFEEVEQILESIKNSPPSEEYEVENIDNLESEISFHFTKCSSCFKGKEVEITIAHNDDC